MARKRYGVSSHPPVFFSQGFYIASSPCLSTETSTLRKRMPEVSEIQERTSFWGILRFLEKIMPWLSGKRAGLSILRVRGLVWADKLVEMVFWLLVIYLTDIWKLDVTHASAIVNGFTGLETIIPLGMAFLMDAYMGEYRMLFLSSLAYSFGMLILIISTVFGGRCYPDEPKCIGFAHMVLFLTALAVKAVGVSGFKVSLRPFLEQQKKVQIESGRDDQKEKKKEKFVRFCGKFSPFGVVLLLNLLVLAVTYILSTAPWYALFDVAGGGMLLATFLFIRGSYEHAGPRGSPLTTVCRDFVAFASKVFHFPRHANELHEEARQPTLHFPPGTHGLRITEEAEETKIFIRMIPLWMTFIMSGVVTSVGDTYFLEQAGNMNRKVGRLEFPVFILHILYRFAKYCFTKLCRMGAIRLIQSRSRKYVAAIGIAVAMVFSMACCTTAAYVERRRLDETEDYGLLAYPDDIIPMSIFWLLPQFFLLAAHDGICEYLRDDLDGISGYSIACFSNCQVPDSIIPYLKVLTEGAFGVGIWGSVVLVYAVGKVSESGGKPSWFQETLNYSRLDNYYRTVAVMSFMNLYFCIMVATWYINKHLANRETKTDNEGGEGLVMSLRARTEHALCTQTGQTLHANHAESLQYEATSAEAASAAKRPGQISNDLDVRQLSTSAFVRIRDGMRKDKGVASSQTDAIKAMPNNRDLHWMFKGTTTGTGPSHVMEDRDRIKEEEETQSAAKKHWNFQPTDPSKKFQS